VAREVNCRRDVIGIARRDRIGARLARPRIEPSGTLREPGLLADVVGILQIRRELIRCGAIGIGAEYGDGRVDANQSSADRIVQALPVGLRWPRGIGRTATTESASGGRRLRQRRALPTRLQLLPRHMLLSQLP